MFSKDLYFCVFFCPVIVTATGILLLLLQVFAVASAVLTFKVMKWIQVCNVPLPSLHIISCQKDGKNREGNQSL